MVAWILKYKMILSSRVRQNSAKVLPTIRLDISLLVEAKQQIIRLHQQQAFKKEVETQITFMHSGNRDRKTLMKRSSVYKLNPFIVKKGLLRVRGRLNKSNLHFTDVHPVLFGKDNSITRLIVEWCNKKTAHGGRGITINEIRSNGFWGIRCNAIVRSLVGKCVKCRLLRGNLGEQKIADLPTDEPPFTNYGVEMLGSFLVQEGIKELKKYGAPFICLSSRAVHIECTCSLETDSFIQAVRRFVVRRGNIRV